MQRLSVTKQILSITLVLFLSGEVAHGNEKNQQLRVAREMIGLLEAYAVYKMGQYDLALERFQTLADKGSVKAMYNLGNMYADGLGVEADHAKAFAWHLKAAKAGDKLSMEAVAEALDDGEGVSMSPQQASYWRSLADDGLSR